MGDHATTIQCPPEARPHPRMRPAAPFLAGGGASPGRGRSPASAPPVP